MSDGYPEREMRECFETKMRYEHGPDDGGVTWSELLAKTHAYLAAVDAWRAKGAEEVCDCRDGLVKARSGRDALCPKCHPVPKPAEPQRTCEEILGSYLSMVNMYGRESTKTGAIVDAIKAHRVEVLGLEQRLERMHFLGGSDERKISQLNSEVAALKAEGAERDKRIADAIERIVQSNPLHSAIWILEGREPRPRQ